MQELGVGHIMFTSDDMPSRYGGKNQKRSYTKSEKKNLPSGSRCTLKTLQAQADACPNALLGGIIEFDLVDAGDAVAGDLDSVLFALGFHRGKAREGKS